MKVYGMIEKEISFHDYKDKYSSYREKNLEHVRGATKEPNQENLEHFKILKNDEGFERKKEYRCYHCSYTEDFRSNCPQLKQSESIASVNWVISMPGNDMMSPYTVIAEVNGFKMPILCETKTKVDIVSRKRISSEKLTSEHIWVIQSFDD
ncbi:hypothetical protein AVEN_69913-1 [Araneus ventricosus]|uniref:Uncharacterized protein n=1 Tax=Araneus ventricosus TaxID=182803 RepID=A0A4Y2P6E4_ARAVE|nr:hypothetical protein AVEN_69913-1 [Araneus ventricosus]